MDRDQFVDTFGNLFQGPPWIASRPRPPGPSRTCTALAESLRGTLLFEAPAERRLKFIRQYPDLAGVATREGRLSSRSSMDQAYAASTSLDGDEYTTFDELTRAYKEKFGFPLVVAVRENTKETILRSGNARLQNSPAAEQATALVEIAKIANLRLLDIVEEPVDQPVTSARAWSSGGRAGQGTSPWPTAASSRWGGWNRRTAIPSCAVTGT